MPEIAFIMGKSASGKDNIYRELVADGELKLKTVTLYTTRPMRSGETEGKEYHFVDEAYPDKLENENKIIELRAYNTVYGVWKYFTADDGQIDIKSGEKYIIIGTLEAYDKFVKYYGKEHILPIYIETEDGLRLERALKREREQEKPKYAEMCRRFLADSEDFSEDNLLRAGISKRFFNNAGLKECVQEVKKEIIDKMINTMVQ